MDDGLEDGVTRMVVGDVGGGDTGTDSDVIDLIDADPRIANLPRGAVMIEGGARLLLDYPVKLRTRAVGSETVSEENFAELRFYRVYGADMRKVMAAKGAAMTQIALARATHLSAAKIALLIARMDASDKNAADTVVAILTGLDGVEAGLPEQASVGDDGKITLKILYPANPAAEDVAVPGALLFRRLNGDDLTAFAQSKDNVLPVAIARACGMKPVEATALFDALDAADAMAAHRVIGFLLGSGRRNGG